MDETKPPPPPPSPKRRRREEEGKFQAKVEGISPNTNKEIVTSLVLLEEADKGEDHNHHEIEQGKGEKTDEEEFHRIDQNRSEKKRQMMDYYSKFQEFSRQGEEMGRAEFRKTKNKATNAIVTAIAVGAAAESTSDEKSAAAPPQRRLWVKNRSKDWWDQCNSPDFPDEEFKKAFRMGKDTFDLICNELSSFVAKENTMLRDAVPVRQRVAVCVWRLATGEPLRLVSKKFGLGISTCHSLCWKFVVQ